MKAKILLLLIFLLAVSLRLYHIVELPGEWFGDISNVHEYMMEILEGKWPFYFSQSPGPVYHYLIFPFVLFFRNQGYETYKYSSILVSLAGLWGAYLFVKELSGRKIALLTTFISSFSFWYLVWSRIGNSQIMIPALVSFSSLFLIRFVKFNRISDLIRTMAVVSLGWYIYPQTFILPPFIFVFILFYLLTRITNREIFQHLTVFVIVALLGILPFILIIESQNKNFEGNFGATGYLGKKIFPVFEMSGSKFFGKLGKNLAASYMILHVEGDKTFRVNVAGKPQLDRISGVLFILGIIFMIRKYRRVFTIYIILLLLVLPLPSVSPAIPETEIPNSARTIAVIPSVYLLVGLGFWQMFILLRKLISSKMAALAVLLPGLTMANFNFNHYF